MDRNHQKFLGHLKNSQSAVEVVSSWLKDKGFRVEINETRYAPDAEHWEEYADDGDISMMVRIEVKHLSASFTCAADWPFKGKFIVCAKHAWDRAKPKPHAFIILNQSMTHFGIVKGESFPAWQITEKEDHRYENVIQTFYFIDPTMVVWGKF